MSLPQLPPMRMSKPRSGQVRVVVMVLLSVLGSVGVYLSRQHSEQAIPNSGAATPQATVRASFSEARNANANQNQVLIESLPKSAQRPSWFEPTDSELWQLSGWFLNEGRLQSSELAISRATFRQSYQNVSLSFRLNWQPTPADSINSDELLSLHWVDETDTSVMKLGLRESRIELEGVNDSSRQVIRSVGLSVDSFDCTLRIVQTNDRLLTAVNDQLVWNIARPDPLNGSRFVSLETTNRALTISELRFETSDSL